MKVIEGDYDLTRMQLSHIAGSSWPVYFKRGNNEIIILMPEENTAHKFWSFCRDKEYFAGSIPLDWPTVMNYLQYDPGEIKITIS